MCLERKGFRGSHDWVNVEAVCGSDCFVPLQELSTLLAKQAPQLCMEWLLGCTVGPERFSAGGVRESHCRGAVTYSLVHGVRRMGCRIYGIGSGVDFCTSIPSMFSYNDS